MHLLAVVELELVGQVDNELGRAALGHLLGLVILDRLGHPLERHERGRVDQRPLIHVGRVEHERARRRLVPASDVLAHNQVGADVAQARIVDLERGDARVQVVVGRVPRRRRQQLTVFKPSQLFSQFVGVTIPDISISFLSQFYSYLFFPYFRFRVSINFAYHQHILSFFDPHIR